MEVIIVDSTAQVGLHGADAIASAVAHNPHTVIGVATGSSPLAVYAELARRVAARSLDLGGITAFALDEYLGLPLDHPQSYAAFIRREVTTPLRLDAARVHVPDGNANDPEANCAAFERAIDVAGGIDVQLLGIGSNGHIGFNEPTSSLSSRTRIKTLSDETREDNARFFTDVRNVPTHCITQGLGTILDARHVVLLAQGVHKSDAVARAIEGPLSSMCPASALQLHPHVTVVVDQDAASRLTLGTYYRQAYRGLDALRKTAGQPANAQPEHEPVTDTEVMPSRSRYPE
jgi:glucosamine-6-phosphate isomerase